MDRKVVIDWLCRLRSQIDVFIPENFPKDRFKQALSYAIDSLQVDETYQLEYEYSKTKALFGKMVEEEDCISRQAVLDELEKWDWQDLYLPIHFKENIIDVLPSVYPKNKVDAEELLRMFAFAHKHLGNIFWENQIRIQADKLMGVKHGNDD